MIRCPYDRLHPLRAQASGISRPGLAIGSEKLLFAIDLPLT